MSIRIPCPNGHILEIADQYIGKLVRCGLCQSLLVAQPPVAAIVAAEPPPVVMPPPQPVPVSPPPPRIAPPLAEGIQLSLEEPELLPPEVPQELPQEPKEVPERRPNRLPEPPLSLERACDVVDALQRSSRDLVPTRAEEPSRGMSNAERMQRVGTGLAFLYAKLLLILAAAFLSMTTSLLASLVIAIQEQDRSGKPPGGMGFFHVTGCVVLCLGASAIVCGGVGSLLCFWSPRKSHARVHIMISFVLEAGGALFSLLGGIFMLSKAPEGRVLSHFATILSFAAWIFFMIFLRMIADYLRDKGTADEVVRLLVLAIILGVAGPVCLIILAVAFARVPLVGVFMVIGGALFWLAAYVKIMIGILNVIAILRQKIDSRF
jgi:hypothetical protein